MYLASQTAQKIRSQYPQYTAFALINTILTEHSIVVDLWPVHTEKFSGCLWNNAGVWTIMMNTKQHPRRKLFTITHELGHYFLHRHIKSQFNCTTLSAPTSALEKQANAFAAELLMPAKQVQQYLQNKYQPPRTAQLLGVSETALQYRLQHLRLE